jgi:hypothetical protein
LNLGLEPWEALAVGLEVATIEADDKRRAVLCRRQAVAIRLVHDGNTVRG